jgi:hypothetical protein
MRLMARSLRWRGKIDAYANGLTQLILDIPSHFAL